MMERFKIIDVELPMPYLDVQMDGKSITIADLVNVANQLTEALNNRGCYFQVKKDEPE
jgi:hypothetical protein